MMVFLTDGENGIGDPQPAIAALKATSIRVITVGLGSSIDGALLRQAASGVSDFYYAPSGKDLQYIYDTITNSICRNRAPLVKAGPDQGVLGVKLPLTLQLNGEVHDDGPLGDPRLTSVWSQVSGPEHVVFLRPESPVTEVMFFFPGTYVLRLTATDTLATTSADVTVVVDDLPSLEGASLTLVAQPAESLMVGSTLTATATLLDAVGVPIHGFPIAFSVTGAHTRSGTPATNASGQVQFTYIGITAGADQIRRWRRE